jgi:hypothetical protein
MTRIGLGGHSQGGQLAASAANRSTAIQVVFPLADLFGNPVTASNVKSVIVGGGMSDSVVNYQAYDVSAYNSSTAPLRRVFGITNGDHLDVTDLCVQTNSDGQTAIQVGDMAMVCGINFLDSLAHCGHVMPVTAGPTITNFATTAALEETLHCQNRDAQFNGFKAMFTQVGDFQHKP